MAPGLPAPGPLRRPVRPLHEVVEPGGPVASEPPPVVVTPSLEGEEVENIATQSDKKYLKKKKKKEKKLN